MSVCLCVWVNQRRNIVHISSDMKMFVGILKMKNWLDVGFSSIRTSASKCRKSQKIDSLYTEEKLVANKLTFAHNLVSINKLNIAQNIKYI